MTEYQSRFERADRIRNALIPILAGAILAIFFTAFAVAVRDHHRAEAACAARHAVLVEEVCIDSSAVRSVP